MTRRLLRWMAALTVAGTPAMASAATSVTALPSSNDLSQSSYGVSTDAFDVQQGATVTGHSGVLFDPDHAIGGATPGAGEPYSVDFDGAGPGFISFQTAAPVMISGFNLYVGGDAPGREFSTIGLSGSSDGVTFTDLGTFDFTGTSYSAYGSNVLELTSTFASVADQFFRIDGVSKAGSGPQGGRILELDAISASPIAAVPEPTSWAMMIVGFGMIGLGLRYRQRRSMARYA